MSIGVRCVEGDAGHGAKEFGVEGEAEGRWSKATGLLLSYSFRTPRRHRLELSHPPGLRLGAEKGYRHYP